MSSTFEITCPQQFIQEVSRRAKTKRDNLDVVDVQVVMAIAAELFMEQDQAKALSLASKMAKNVERRKQRARS